jgi:hypothetical protein
MKSLGLLIAATLACWLLVVIPARWLWGDSAVLFSGTAALLCLVPSAATLLWTQWAFKGQPEQQLLAVLGGTAVRLVFVVAAGMALFHLVPAFQYQRFWLWVIAFYLVTLAAEVLLLARQSAAAEQAQKN